MSQRLTGFTPKVRQQIKDRAMDYCADYPACEVMAYCQGAWASIELHHRRGRGMGSTRRPETNQAANGLACCTECHRWITEHPERSYKHGWLLRQNQTPNEVPVLRRGVLVLLDNYGGVIDQSVPFGVSVPSEETP